MIHDGRRGGLVRASGRDQARRAASRRGPRAGLDAIEAITPITATPSRRCYLERARALGLLVTGGSDFHGDDPMSHRTRRRVVGGVTLPAEAWAALEARRGHRGGRA